MFRVFDHLSRFIFDFLLFPFSLSRCENLISFILFFFFWQLMQYFLKTFASPTSETTFAPRYMNYKNHCRNSWSDISLMKCVISRTSFHLRQKINWKKFARLLSKDAKSTFNKYCWRSSDFCLLMTDHFFFNWVPYDTRITLKNVTITFMVRTWISLIRLSSVSLIKLVIRWLRLFEKKKHVKYILYDATDHTSHDFFFSKWNYEI